jgi:hypothetical protein
MRNPLPSGRWLLLVVGVIAIELSASASVRAQAANPELDALLTKGVEFSGGQMRKLRPPTLIDGLDAAAQQQAIGAVLAMKKGRPIDYKDFTVRNLNTPYVLLIDQDPQYDGNAPGHSINLWFVVYGNLKTVAAPKFLKDQFKPDKTSRTDVLNAEDLKQRQIVPRVIPNGDEWFVHGTFKLLPAGVRLQVQATERVVETKTKESATIAGQIDRRFDNDARYPNDWRPAPQGVVGGPPTLYYSSGAYAKVTQLVQPAGALLVEYHFVYDEPQPWFNGANLLRSKLPQSAPDDVRTFRRDVKTAEQ